MFTYGYIREATMAHLDLDEIEAQAMNLQSRFHIFANEAMQAICGGKPKYEYIEAIIVKEYDPLVKDGSIIRLATEAEIKLRDTSPELLTVVFLDDDQLKAYYSKKNTYLVGDQLKRSDDFIAFANKQAWKFVTRKYTAQDLYNAEYFNTPLPPLTVERKRADEDYDFSYIGKNGLKFYKEGRYLIPAKYMWFRFISGLSDDAELDMPSDILLSIPLYIASICLQIDNPQKANVKRAEFEMALSRCTNTDFMELNEVRASW